MSFHYDFIVDSTENTDGILDLRKKLCSHAFGFVLETGVGSSRNLAFYPPGIKLLGVDWSIHCLNIAEEKYASHINYEYKTEDVEKMTFKDNVFDTVVDTFALPYYVYPERALKEIKRVCK